MSELLDTIKRIATEAVRASVPGGTLYGEVVSTSPLKVKVDQKMTLTDKQLVFSRGVSDYSIDITIDGERHTCTVHGGIKDGDRVILEQLPGGQQFIIQDRLK